MPWTAVPRPRLYPLLEHAAPITLLYGLPGSGKTYLVQEWLQVRSITASWLVCGEIDNDPVCFWQRLLNLVDPAGEASDAMAFPYPSTLEAAALALTKRLERRPLPVHLVLDAYQCVQSADSQRLLRSLLHSLPAKVRVHTTLLPSGSHAFLVIGEIVK